VYGWGPCYRQRARGRGRSETSAAAGATWPLVSLVEIVVIVLWMLDRSRGSAAVTDQNTRSRPSCALRPTMVARR